MNFFLFYENFFKFYNKITISDLIPLLFMDALKNGKKGDVEKFHQLCQKRKEIEKIENGLERICADIFRETFPFDEKDRKANLVLESFVAGDFKEYYFNQCVRSSSFGHLKDFPILMAAGKKFGIDFNNYVSPFIKFLSHCSLPTKEAIEAYEYYAFNQKTIMQKVEEVGEKIRAKVEETKQKIMADYGITEEMLKRANELI